MNELVTSRPRRVIPRWRDFASTAVLGELSLPGEIRKAPPIATDLEGAQIRFEQTPDLSTASELLVSSVIQNSTRYAEKAASYILANNLPVVSLLKTVALNVLGKQAPPREETHVNTVNILDTKCIKFLRNKTRTLLSDSIAWIELALAYTTIGKKEKALRAVKTALQLAPNNRFVIRSTVRCLLHFDEQRMAFDILSKNARTKSDPWLLASQLAVSEILHKSSHLIKDARELLQSQRFLSSDLSELSASLATTELYAGNDKRSRRLFHASLDGVTENALAQVLWAKAHIKLDEQVSQLSPPRNFEAEARRSIMAGKWTEALVATLKWQNDESFSARPAELASFIASVVEENFPLAEDIARKGLVANPDHGMLINNLAFAQACQGKCQEARNTISKIVLATTDINSQAALLATKGLILFREGDLEGGRDGYRAAMNFAEENKLPSIKTMALIFLAREEWRAKTTLAPEAVKVAEVAATEERLATVLIAANKLAAYVAKDTSAPATLYIQEKENKNYNWLFRSN